MHYASTYTSTCGGMRSRLALGGRRRGAGARVPSPRLLPRQVALLEEHVLPRGRDPRVLVLVEDDLRLRRRTGRLILVGAMYGASVAATAAASDSPRLVAVLPVPIEAVRARVILLVLHVSVSQSLFLIFLTGWSCEQAVRETSDRSNCLMLDDVLRFPRTETSVFWFEPEHARVSVVRQLASSGQRGEWWVSRRHGCHCPFARLEGSKLIGGKAWFIVYC